MCLIDYFRSMEKAQNKSNNGQVPGMATVETTAMVAVGKSKNETSLNIKKVFKRSKKSKLKNMRIPEVLYHFYGVDILYHRYLYLENYLDNL